MITKQNRFWILFPAAFMFLLDVLVTYLFQPAEYWRVSYEYTTESSPHGLLLMRYHPLAFLAFILAYLLVVGFLVYRLPAPWHKVIALDKPFNGSPFIQAERYKNTLSPKNKELLVALLPGTSALDILKSEGWYHMPVESMPGRWREGWRPQAMAFYQGKVFGEGEAYRIRYFGEVDRIDVLPRKELFPNDDENQDKAEKLYYRVAIRDLKSRYRPIVSYRPRRLVFLPTTRRKFDNAEQINDLFDGSPLEDRLWQILKQNGIFAERQWKIIVDAHNYYLDFAIFCRKGRLAIETDGYTDHYDDRNQIDYDTFRRNEIELDGWRSLHFTSHQVNEGFAQYFPQIQRAIEQLGGVEEPENYVRKTDEVRGRYIVDGEEPF